MGMNSQTAASADEKYRFPTNHPDPHKAGRMMDKGEQQAKDAADSNNFPKAFQTMSGEGKAGVTVAGFTGMGMHSHGTNAGGGSGDTDIRVSGTDYPAPGAGQHSYDKESGVASDGKTPEESRKDAGFAAQMGGMQAQRKDAFAPGGQGTPLEGISLGSDRVRGALANIPGFEHLGPSPDFVRPAGGEVDLYRSAVEMANEFLSLIHI